MSDLYSYLDVSGPEYAYLGHFRDMEYLCQGHNDMSNPAEMEQTISSGQIPDIKTGRNYAADAEPSEISSEDHAGMTPPADPMPTQGPMQSQGSKIVDPLIKSVIGGGLKTLFGVP